MIKVTDCTDSVAGMSFWYHNYCPLWIKLHIRQCFVDLEVFEG
jgi:hypothetical protein